MKIKKYMAIMLIFFIVMALSPDITFATGIEDIKSGMEGVKSVTTGGKISNALNAVIKLIQIAGSGVAVIVVTMLRCKIHAC